jgi:predicted ATP-grasp superfamily ATP-dependent carboligase
MNNRAPVVVIGGGVHGLGVIRNLGRHGIDVYCVTETPHNIAFHSRYCKGSNVIPFIERDSTVLATNLSSIAARFSRVPYIHPTSDLSVLTLSQIIPELKTCVASIPRFSTVQTLVIKKQFYQSLQKHGVSFPATFYLDETHPREAVQEIGFPVYIKPSLSQTFAQRFRKKGFIASTMDELRHYLQIAHEFSFEVMIQEIVFGPPRHLFVVTGYFDKTSTPVLLFATQNIRQPSFFQDNSCSVSIPLSHIHESVHTIIQYLTSLRYHGIFIAEFKWDARDHTMKLLEVNARSGAYNSHPVACGVNHILAAYHEATGHELQPTTSYMPHVYCIDLFIDLWSISRLAINQKYPFREIVHTYRGKKHWLIYARDDPLPFVNRVRAALCRVLSN